MKTCRIVFTILCAMCLAALPLVGIFGGMDYIVLPLFFAGVFFLLMLFCKKKQLEKEAKSTPTPDFFTPINSDAETQTKADESEKE